VIDASRVGGGNIHDAIYMFSYNCRQCYEYEPRLSSVEKILKNKYGDSTAFTGMPLIRSNEAEYYAKVFYSAKSLSVLEKVNPQIYMAAIKAGDGKVADESTIIKIFNDAGVSSSEFTKRMNSFSVATQVRDARILSFELRIAGVNFPLIIISGKYALDKKAAFLGYLDAIGAPKMTPAQALPSQYIHQAVSSPLVDGWLVINLTNVFDMKYMADQKIGLQIQVENKKNEYSINFVMIKALNFRIIVDGQLIEQADFVPGYSFVTLSDAVIKKIMTGKKIRVDAYTQERGWANSVTFEGEGFNSALKMRRNK